MALPHFHTMPKNIEPIFKSLYEALFITSDGNRFIANIERFEIIDNIISCKIQDYPETSISNINKSKTLIIEYFNTPDHYVAMI